MRDASKLSPFHYVFEKAYAKDAPYTAKARSVAIVIASYINKISLVAFPSVATIAKRTGLGRTAATAAIKELCDGPLPLLIRNTRQVSPTKRRTEYRIVRNPVTFKVRRDANRERAWMRLHESEFWPSYPKQIGRNDSRAAWKTLIKRMAIISPGDMRFALARVLEWLRYEDERGFGRRDEDFIPAPASWLRAEDFRDMTPLEREEGG